MNFLKASAPTGSWNPLLAVLGTLVVALGLTALLGWHIDSPRMTRWAAGKTPMVYNTAISFVVLGTALLGAGLGRRKSSRTRAILSSLLSFLTLFEYVGGASLGIDELLMKSGETSGYPGRIAPNSAVCLLLISIVVVCMQRSKGSRWRTIGSPLLASVALGISAISVVGYLTGFSTFGWGRFIPMAIPASVGLTLVSLAALTFVWRDRDSSNLEQPSWLYMTVTVAGRVMTCSLWQAPASEEHARIQYAVAGQIAAVKVRLLTDIGFRIEPVERFARRWERTEAPDARRWEFEIGMLVRDVPGLHAIGRAQTGSLARWVHPKQEVAVRAN